MELQEKYRLFPDLSPRDYAKLKEDIHVNGVQRPVVVDEDGIVLDGHQRRRACRELGIECPTHVMAGLDERAKVDLILMLNEHKFTRHSRALIEVHLTRHFEWGPSVIADIVMVDRSTVRRDLKHPAHGLSRDGSSHRLGLDRRRHPSTKGEKGGERTRLEAAAVPRLLPVAEMDGHRLFEGTLQSLADELDAASVDAIITDGPGALWTGDRALTRAADAAVSYRMLGQLGNRVLKPGGALLITVNRSHLVESLAGIGERLYFTEMLAYVSAHAEWSSGLKTADWHPVLWFSKGEPSTPPAWPPCTVKLSGDPRLVESINSGDLIESFTRAGDTILDPLLNSLSTMVLGIAMGRRFIGATAEPTEWSRAVFYDQVLTRLSDEAMVAIDARLKYWATESGAVLVRRKSSRAKADDLAGGGRELVKSIVTQEYGARLGDGDDITDLTDWVVDTMCDRARARH